MDLSDLMETTIFGIPAMAFVVYFARICDVSMGTIRIVFISRGYRMAATWIGFFEVTIWILAVGQVIRNINTPILIVAYTLGFASGSYLGMFLESQMQLGSVILRIITKRQARTVLDRLSEQNFGVTRVPAEGPTGKVDILFLVLRRRDLKRATDIVKRFHPKAFFSVEDVRMVKEGIFPKSRLGRGMRLIERK